MKVYEDTFELRNEKDYFGDTKLINDWNRGRLGEQVAGSIRSSLKRKCLLNKDKISTMPLMIYGKVQSRNSEW